MTIRPLGKVEITPLNRPLARGDIRTREKSLLPLHPSHSPLKGERTEDEAFSSREGWGGVLSIYARGLLFKKLKKG